MTARLVSSDQGLTVPTGTGQRGRSPKLSHRTAALLPCQAVPDKPFVRRRWRGVYPGFEGWGLRWGLSALNPLRARPSPRCGRRVGDEGTGVSCRAVIASLKTSCPHPTPPPAIGRGALSRGERRGNRWGLRSALGQEETLAPLGPHPERSLPSVRSRVSGKRASPIRLAPSIGQA